MDLEGNHDTIIRWQSEIRQRGETMKVHGTGRRADRCRPIDFLLERPLTALETWTAHKGGTNGESRYECVGLSGWFHRS